MSETRGLRKRKQSVDYSDKVKESDRWATTGATKSASSKKLKKGAAAAAAAASETSDHTAAVTAADKENKHEHNAASVPKKYSKPEASSNPDAAAGKKQMSKRATTPIKAKPAPPAADAVGTSKPKPVSSLGRIPLKAIAVSPSAPATSAAPVDSVATAAAPPVEAGAVAARKAAKTKHPKADSAAAPNAVSASAGVSASPKSVSRRVLSEINEQQSLQQMLDDKERELIALRSGDSKSSKAIAEWKATVAAEKREYEKAIALYKLQLSGATPVAAVAAPMPGIDAVEHKRLQRAESESKERVDKLTRENAALAAQLSELKAELAQQTQIVGTYQLLTTLRLTAGSGDKKDTVHCKGINRAAGRKFEFDLESSVDDQTVTYKPISINLNGFAYDKVLKEDLDLELHQIPEITRLVLTGLYEPKPATAAAASE